MIGLKEVYKAAEAKDGERFLIARGIKKTALKFAAWIKEAGPSDKLRRWFSHDPVKWDEFGHRYFGELDAKSEVLALEQARPHDVEALEDSAYLLTIAWSETKRG